jgi:hypothetical protein
VNAVAHLVRTLPPSALLRLARHRIGRFDATAPVPDAATRADLADAVIARYAGELVELLNACHGDDLERLAAATGARPDGDAAARTSASAGTASDSSGAARTSAGIEPGTATPDPGARQPALRLALWRWGARLEAGGADVAGTALQPAPRLVAGRLVHHAPPRGPHPPSAAWPRPLPPPADPAPPAEEPDSIDELLAAADRAIGVRLGARGRDKGAWGGRAAELLGVVERGDDAPDWRGDVELKTVPAHPDPGGGWRIAEDPAIAMRGAAPIAKLQRVLWLVRAPVGDADATILSWYLLEWDAEIARLVGRYLHTRPKGPAGGAGEAWYLYRRFFAEAGLLATLNGSGVTR